MTESNSPQPVGNVEQGRELRLQDLWLITLRHRWLALGTLVAVVGLMGLYTVLKRPVYESGATLRIDEEENNAGLLSEMSPLPGLSKGTIETEMLVLGSRQLAEAVADSLALHAALEEPRVARSAIFRRLQVPREGAEGVYVLRHQGGGRYAARAETAGPAAPEALVEIGEVGRVGEVVMELDPALRGDPPATIELRVRPFRATVEDLREAIRIGRPDLVAQIVSVQYRDTDPHLAAAVPNSLAEHFLLYKARTSKAESRSTVGFLREQVESYEQQLRAAEERLRDFRSRAQVVSLSDEATEQVQRLARMQAEREDLLVQQGALRDLLSRAQAESRARGESAPFRQLAAFPLFLANPAVQDILQSLIELENQQAELLSRRTRDNPDVQVLESRIQALERQLQQTAAGYLESLEHQIESLDRNLARFGNQLETIPDREIEFARFARQQKLLEEIYTLLQTRLKEAEIQEAIEPGSVRVIDPALVPLKPVSPRPLRNLVLGVMLGLVLAVGVAFTRDAMDTKVRTKEDAQLATGGMPLLGFIPRIRAQRAANGGNGHGKSSVRVVRPEEMIEERLVTHLDPRNPASEAYRTLRTNITFSSLDGAPQLLVVTSALPGDGKSTSSSNLAITLAQQGSRTLLVDADLRRGVLHQVFGLRQAPGLTHVLLERSSLEDAIQEVAVADSDTPLHLLASGVFPPNPSEMLGSERMRRLLARLRERYDAIVLDAPPLNLVTDAAVLGTFADATILVTRVAVTDKRALHHAASQLYQLRARIGGIVLNDIDAEGTSRYYGYGVGYGYSYGGDLGKN